MLNKSKRIIHRQISNRPKLFIFGKGQKWQHLVLQKNHNKNITIATTITTTSVITRNTQSKLHCIAGRKNKKVLSNFLNKKQ